MGRDDVAEEREREHGAAEAEIQVVESHAVVDEAVLDEEKGNRVRTPGVDGASGAEDGFPEVGAQGSPEGFAEGVCEALHDFQDEGQRLCGRGSGLQELAALGGKGLLGGRDELRAARRRREEWHVFRRGESRVLEERHWESARSLRVGSAAGSGADFGSAAGADRDARWRCSCAVERCATACIRRHVRQEPVFAPFERGVEVMEELDAGAVARVLPEAAVLERAHHDGVRIDGGDE